MTIPGLRPGRAPRLAVKILAFSFGVIALVLAVVFLVLSWQARQRLTKAVADSLDASQRRFAALETRRQRELRLQALALAENPTLKAAVDTYQSERALAGAPDQLLRTVELELADLQDLLEVPGLSATDADGRILASAGRARGDWPPGSTMTAPDPAGGVLETVVLRGRQTYVVTVVPMMLGPDLIGGFAIASPLDDSYAASLGDGGETRIAIVHDGRVVGSSLPPAVRDTIDAAALPSNGVLTIGEDEFVVRRLTSVGAADIYAVASLTDALGSATSEVGAVLAAIALGALLLAAGGSWWLAHTVAAPIDELTGTLARMARDRDLQQPMPVGGSSRELDSLSRTFDELRQALVAAEAESEATYSGVIGTLAAALDARDPYTAGHSQRVAELSVAIGEAMALDADTLQELRLGALLHDIGKIGVPDAILRKPGTLTPDEFDQIKRHTTLGARILKPLAFLADQVAIVELHHERPDGRGYPYGLQGDDIPLLARIVHVADAFDAITTARAYRPGRPTTVAIREIQACAGSDFDEAVVAALMNVPSSALPSSPRVRPIPARGLSPVVTEPAAGGSA